MPLLSSVFPVYIYILSLFPSWDFLIVQVEVAHGGRGHSSSIDRHSYRGGGGGRGGVSRRSEYRGMFMYTC